MGLAAQQITKDYTNKIYPRPLLILNKFQEPLGGLVSKILTQILTIHSTIDQINDYLL